MELVENERDLLEQVNNVATLRECFAWLQRCDECIEWLEERRCAKRPRLSIGNKQCLVAKIVRLESARLDYRDVLYILAVIIRVLTTVTRRDSISREIDTAFENRILIVYRCGD